MDADLVNAIYTPREQAVELLKERQRDLELQLAIRKWLDFDLPECFNVGRATATLARHIFTPNYELESFLEHVEQSGLNPVLLEYPDDKFVTFNKDKYSLAKLFFFQRKDDTGQLITQKRRIIDFTHAEHKRMSDLNTIWNIPLVDFHHQLLGQFHPQLLGAIFNGSPWVIRAGVHAQNYYSKFFALFLANSILFDNFRTQDFEAMFTKEIVLPAFDYVTGHFGVKPLVCRLQTVEEENNPFWWTYPPDRLRVLESLTKKHEGGS